MAKYWCRFFDRDEQLVKAERLIAPDDEKAIADARGAAPIGTVRFQVWRNVNFVHEENVALRRAANRGRDGAASSERMIGAAALSGIARLSSIRRRGVTRSSAAPKRDGPGDSSRAIGRTALNAVLTS